MILTIRTKRKLLSVNGLFANWVSVSLVCVLLSACKTELHSRVSEKDANEILTELYAAGIPASKTRQDENDWSIEVGEQNLQPALQVISEHGLPRERFADTGDLFKKDGLVSTPMEERVRFLYAVSQELAHTLSQIDGVVTARVHPVIPANDPLVDDVRPSSASVFIKHRREADLQSMAPAIKNLVMRGIEGLAYENISLTFVTAEEPARTEALSPAAADGIGNSTSVIVLATLLLAALTGLSYLWLRYRAVVAEPSADNGEPDAADEDEHSGRKLRFRRRGNKDNSHVEPPAMPGEDGDASFSTDAPSARRAT